MELSIQLNLWGVTRWGYLKGSLPKQTTNVFELFENPETKTIAVSKVYSTPIENLVESIRKREDVVLLISLLNCNPIDLLEMTEDNDIIDILITI